MRSLPHESVAKLTHHPFDSTVMNVRIGSAQIAERFRRTAMNGLEYKPVMRSWPDFRSRDRKAKFKRHIESWRLGRGPIKLNSR